MIGLDQAKVGKIYYLEEWASDPKLREMGFLKGKEIVLSALTDANGIVQIAGSRLALDRSILASIRVSESQEEAEVELLSNLLPGQTGRVKAIQTSPATKQRLMAMGITRGVTIFVRKLAPLGDPMELHLRGYSLSLRKEDASLIQVIREDKEIK